MSGDPASAADFAPGTAERGGLSHLFLGLLFLGLLICFVPRVFRPRATRCLDTDADPTFLPPELAAVRRKAA